MLHKITIQLTILTEAYDEQEAEEYTVEQLLTIFRKSGDEVEIDDIQVESSD